MRTVIPESQTAVPAVPKSLSPGADAWRRLRRNPVAVISGMFILILVLVAICAPLFTHYAYDFLDTKHYASVPSPPDSRHALGTDGLGEDILSRLLYGARVSLGVALIVVIVEVMVGVPLGLTAGYYGGKTDTALMRLTDVMFAFPDILLAIMLSAIVRSGSQAMPPQSSFLVLFFALGVVGWPGLARLVRGQALIEAARAVGVKDRHIIFRHLLPNLLSPIIVQVTQDIAGVILAEATLSFLGLGVQAPFPSWGRMIEDALVYKETHPLLLLAPGLMLALTVMAFNFFGDALRDAFDPRLRE
jgi:oligopeptide transport system permease protein